MCLTDEIGIDLATLSASVGGAYSSFFCGVPTGERTCRPSRSTSINGSTIYTGAITGGDSDGDGILNASDNCPIVFNPIRPLDNAVQPDVDADGVGDACEGLDRDGDGLSESEEQALGTDPLLVDTDADGLSDGDEVNVHGTDPLDDDTDDDGILDGVEVANGTDPLVPNAAAVPGLRYVGLLALLMVAWTAIRRELDRGRLRET